MSTQACNFVWYELMTPDAAAAKAFYSAVVGWGTRDIEMPGYSYTLFTVKEAGVTGMMEMTPEMCASAQPTWLGYIGVPDTDAYAAKIEAKGGKILRAPDDIPDIGRFAVVADPHGAVFNIMTPLGESPDEWPASDAPGMCGWRELHAGDGPQAFDFYSELFGWTKAFAMDMGPLGVYQTFDADNESIGGMMTKMDHTPVPTWLYYFNVADIAAAIVKVKENGGSILMGPHEVPGGSMIVQCLDPQGAPFSLITPMQKP